MYQPPCGRRSMQEPFLGWMMKLFLCRQSLLLNLIRTPLGHLEISSQDLLTKMMQDQPYFWRAKQIVPILEAAHGTKPLLTTLQIVIFACNPRLTLV